MQSVPRTRSSFKVKEVEKTKIHKMSDGSTAWAQNTQLMGLDKMFLVCFFCSHIMTHEQQHNKRMTFLNGKLKETKDCGPPKKLCFADLKNQHPQTRGGIGNVNGVVTIGCRISSHVSREHHRRWHFHRSFHATPLPLVRTPQTSVLLSVHTGTHSILSSEKIIQTTPLTTPLQDGGDSQHRRAQGGGRAS